MFDVDGITCGPPAVTVKFRAVMDAPDVVAEGTPAVVVVAAAAGPPPAVMVVVVSV